MLRISGGGILSSGGGCVAILSQEEEEFIVLCVAEDRQPRGRGESSQYTRFGGKCGRSNVAFYVTHTEAWLPFRSAWMAALLNKPNKVRARNSYSSLIFPSE